MSHRIRARFRGARPGQAPESNASRAASTARSTSAASPSATSVSVSALAGFTTGNVFLLAASTHSPPMNRRPGVRDPGSEGPSVICDPPVGDSGTHPSSFPRAAFGPR